MNNDLKDHHGKSQSRPDGANPSADVLATVELGCMVACIQRDRLVNVPVLRVRRSLRHESDNSRRTRASSLLQHVATRACGLDHATDPFHFTLVQNIKRDPFEQAVGSSRNRQ
jgi:hypothetical protein